MNFFTELTRMHVQLRTPIGMSGIVAAAKTLYNDYSLSGMFRGYLIGLVKLLVEDRVSNWLQGATMGATADFISQSFIAPVSLRLLTYPFEVCQLRSMQYLYNPGYTWPYETARRIVVEEGIFGLFKGLQFALIATFIESLSFFILCPFVTLINNRYGWTGDTLAHLNCVISKAISYPCETLSRRLASDSCAWVNSKSKPTGTTLTAADIIEESGFCDLWSGVSLYPLSYIIKFFTIKSSNYLCAIAVNHMCYGLNGAQKQPK